MDRAITSGGSGPRLGKVGKAVARIRRMLGGRLNTQPEDAGNSKEDKHSGTSTQAPPDQSEQPTEIIPVIPHVPDDFPSKIIPAGDNDKQSDPCAIASRKNLLKHVEALNTAFNIDYRITQNWLHATSSDLHAYHAMFHKNETLSHETLHLVELSRLINKAFKTFQEEMRKSVEPLEKFQENQFTSKIQLDRALKRWASRDENGEVASICSMSSFEDDQARKRYAKMHSDRDETFKLIETIKWGAVGKYAENLLITAHAAEGLLPFIPDRVRNMPPSAHSPEREEVEDRARDLQLGGTGGFEIHVGKKESLLSIDPKERGVPDEDKFEEWKEMPDWGLKKIYREDENYVEGANHE
ncbi:hypothetical protein I302_106754 [Kwoniella bestiolae CBS 10118]|uniref:Uncharacterized protein n=1 Tax=Kwoniella bestiolae CBS 10118 TaxID=1296100 RepID=A0AAJ8MBK2_9TREE